jgi:hypothetical protein
MTASECAIRQAMRENIFTSSLQPETVAEVERVLQRVREIDHLALTSGDLDAIRALGALQWAAFAALTSIQADRKVHAEFGVKV